METFASSKTMNNQTSCISSLVSKAIGLCILAGLAVTATVAQARLSGPEAFPLPRLGRSAEAQPQSGGDRIPVTLSDPSRPAHVKVSLVNGGITVKAYDGKEVVVEARTRNRENSRDEGGPKRLAISTTGLSVEEENNEISINTDSYM